MKNVYQETMEKAMKRMKPSMPDKIKAKIIAEELCKKLKKDGVWDALLLSKDFEEDGVFLV